MTGKQNAVFWIGLILLLTNFWVSGQSSSLWKSFSTGGTGAVSPGIKPTGTQPKQHMKCPPGSVFDPAHNICVKKQVL